MKMHPERGCENVASILERDDLCQPSEVGTILGARSAGSDAELCKCHVSWRLLALWGLVSCWLARNFVRRNFELAG